MKITITTEQVGDISKTVIEIEADEAQVIKTSKPLSPKTVILPESEHQDSKTGSTDKIQDVITGMDPNCMYCRRRNGPCVQHGGKRSGWHPKDDCVYCRKRGSPCVRHGGERSYNRRKLPQPTTPINNSISRVHAKPIIEAAPIEDGIFTNPWDCDMCLNAGSLCTLHEDMEKAGKTPPKYRNVGMPQPRGN